MPNHQFIGLTLLLLAVLVAASSAVAGDVLGTLKARGVLRCGVSEGIPGFSQRDASGRWAGLGAETAG